MPEEAKKDAESKDVEMKDAKEAGKEDKKDAKKEPEKPKDPRTLLLEAISQNLKTISAGVSAGDPRVMGRVLRSFANLRRTMEPEVLKALLEEFVDASRPSKGEPKSFKGDAETFTSRSGPVVGSGPAGFYTSKYLFKKVEGPLQIDMLERLPTPFGLVRFGVAPDHPEVKNVINDFTAVAQTPNFRFFGNVEVGSGALSLPALRSMYDAVVLCTGASGERRLGIPGEDSEGVLGAPAFVKWYNGHPDYQNLKVPAAGEAAVVVGQGNVALDAARLLVRSPKELQATDMQASAVEQIAAWQAAGLRAVHVVGRRGFVQAAFTNAELRELLTCSEEVLPVVDPEELQMCRNPASEEELSKSRMKKRSLEILDKMAANFEQRSTTSKRVLQIHFLRSPVEVLSESGTVRGLRLGRTALQGEPGKQVAVPSELPALDLACGLVVRSVGFDITPFEGLPLSDRNRVPHVNGCVEPPAESQGGLYVSGWVKRGPQGIIASNIGDAQETASKIVMDAQGKPAKAWPADPLLEALGASGARVVEFRDWQTLEAEELRRGQEMGKAAAKFTSVPHMLQFLGKA
ncbi:MFDR [Symbiodinium natans]|uniref:MFDR protein n=1 Tax=Symbiodinium natans TaxID=878477 RepID=A0A812R756_9DINO|nr:MFDR [Symbiodinium natans]